MFKVWEDKVWLTRGDSANLTVAIQSIVNNSELYIPSELDTMTFSMKKNELDDEPVLEIVSQDNQTIAFAPADTTGIDYGSYVYTVKVETDKGKVFTVVGPACFEVIPF